MPGYLRHISINADDLPRARAFYETLFGWTFKPWGPPDFLQMSGAGTTGGGLQGRYTMAGRTMPGIEVTFGVADIAETQAAVEANGGTVLMTPHHIETVGHVIFFADSEGNLLKAMQYENAWTPAPPARGVIRHVAINADDVGRARNFYGRVLGWAFTPWGPPDFFQTRDIGPGLIGALQQRRTIGGQAMPGIELTVGVEDIEATQSAIRARGGEVFMAPFHIPTVGHLIFFKDSEGNPAGAMQYESVQWTE